MHEQVIPVFKKYDEALNKADITKYGLSIQLGLDGFSFCILQKETNKYLAYESVLFSGSLLPDDLASEVVNNWKSHEWLQSGFQSVLILFETGPFTLVPMPLFDPDHKELIALFNFELPPGHQVFYDKIDSLDASLLYPVPDGLYEQLHEIYPEMKFRNMLSVLTDILMISTKNLPEMKRMFVNVRNGYLDIILIEGKKLLFCNSFTYQSKEDFVYFIIFVLEQLNLNPEEIGLVFSGMIDRRSELFELTYKYIRNIDFQTLPENYTYSYVFNEIPAYYFYTLINSPLCVL